MTAMVLERVRERLVPGEVLWKLHYEPSCSSTQELARAAAARGAGEGWTVVTDVQREGRGRLGRSWVAPPETALLFSTILQPPLDVLPLLPLLAALAVAGGIEGSTGAVPDLKWPNDVLLNGKKLAGILLERPAGPDVVLGVGLNVNQARQDVPDGGTSLAMSWSANLCWLPFSTTSVPSTSGPIAKAWAGSFRAGAAGARCSARRSASIGMAR